MAKKSKRRDIGMAIPDDYDDRDIGMPVRGSGDPGGTTSADVRGGYRAIGYDQSPGEIVRDRRLAARPSASGVYVGGKQFQPRPQSELEIMRNSQDPRRAAQRLDALPFEIGGSPRTGIQPSAGPQREIIQGAYGTMPNGRKVFYDPRTGRRRLEKQVAPATQDSGADIAGEIGTNPAQINASQIDYYGRPMSPNPNYRGTTQPAPAAGTQPQGIMPSTGGGTESAPTTADEGAVYGPGNVSGIRRARQEAFTAKTRDNAARFGLIPGEGGLDGAMARYNRLKNTTQGRGLVNPEAIAAAERAQALASKRGGLTVMQELTMRLNAAKLGLQQAQAAGTEQYRRSQLEMEQSKLRDAQTARGELRTREDAQRREDMTREDRAAETKYLGEQLTALGIPGVLATDKHARDVVTDQAVIDAADAVRVAKSAYDDARGDNNAAATVLAGPRGELEKRRRELLAAVREVQNRSRIMAEGAGPAPLGADANSDAAGGIPTRPRAEIEAGFGIQPSAVPQAVVAPAAPAAPSAPGDGGPITIGGTSPGSVSIGGPVGIQPSAVPQAVVAPAAPAAPSAPTDNPQRAAALQWLKDNPNDPRAPAIRKKLGMQ